MFNVIGRPHPFTHLSTHSLLSLFFCVDITHAVNILQSDRSYLILFEERSYEASDRHHSASSLPQRGAWIHIEDVSLEADCSSRIVVSR